jgi:ring-1,2-phenylacetyl-CoA epoxidase subunit PaaA
MAMTEAPHRVYRENDPDMPQELRELLIRMLTHHVANSTNPHFTALLTHLWKRCMMLAPSEDLKVSYARVLEEWVEHGVINSRVLAGLGVEKVDEPIRQYLFHLPLETFCDLAYFQALGDRVGCYVGKTWERVPYAPLAKMAPKLHKDYLFHATLGTSNLRRICSIPDGRVEANELIKKWWPAALDMFGRSDSEYSVTYVEWGLRTADNEALRQQYIADTVPILEEIGIRVPDHRANRQFL